MQDMNTTEVTYIAGIQYVGDDGSLSLGAHATDLTYDEARAWLDARRTSVARILSRYDRDQYRYFMRIE